MARTRTPRTLRLLVSGAATALPALVLATLAPSASCSRTPLRPGASGDTSGEGGTGGAGGVTVTTTTSSGLGGFTSSSSSSSSGGPVDCAGGEPVVFTVEVPPEGVPAEPGQICAVVSPVESNGAARVTLTKDTALLQTATGTIEVPPQLAPLVVGLPTVEVVSAATPELGAMQATGVQPSPGGFTFEATWPQALNLQPEDWVKLTLRVTLQIACPPADELRTVMAITNVNLCIVDEQLGWVSSGDECKACTIIAEMAPSPIVPEPKNDELPLCRALRLRVVPLARIGRTLVLLAENDGGDEVTYDWVPTAGTIERLAPDVVVWTPPADGGPHMVQAVVQSEDGAAVASWTVEPGASGAFASVEAA